MSAAPYPFEVVETDDGFTWRIIAGCGRTLVYTPETYSTDRAAADAAKAHRQAIARRAEMVDASDGEMAL